MYSFSAGKYTNIVSTGWHHPVRRSIELTRQKHWWEFVVNRVVRFRFVKRSSIDPFLELSLTGLQKVEDVVKIISKNKKGQKGDFKIRFL